VIGTLFGGYGWAVERGEWPALILALPKKFALGMAGQGVVAGAILVAVIAIGVAASLRSRRAIVLFLVALFLAAAPVVPVSKEMQRRYVVMPWLCLSIAFVAGVETLRRRRAVAAVLLIAAPALAIVANRQEWRYEFARTKRMSDEARVFFDLPSNGMLRTPIIPPAAMDELSWLKTDYAKRPAGAGWFYDDLYLCSHDGTGKRFWQYAAATREVREVTTPVRCPSTRVNASLRATFHVRGGDLFWDFGPYTDGTYRVLFADGVKAYDVPRHDGFRLSGVQMLTLRLGYQSPAGWVTYSPDIVVDFKRPVTVWRR
jgi:hypothetical protein